MKILFSVLFIHISFCIAFSQSIEEVDQYARSVSYSTDYSQKSIELTKKFNKESDKARAIFTWIATHFSYDNALKDKIMSGPRKTVVYGDTKEELDQQVEARIDKMLNKMLKRKKGVCQDYAYLFNRMCRIAGLESEFVTGFGRFSPDNIGRQHRIGNHAWNAVKIDGSWKLIDLTWTDGMNDRKNDMGLGFWLTDPALFIWSHFPDEEKWQLLNTPLSKKEFANLPYMHDAYIKYNIEFLYPVSGFIQSSEKSMRFKFKGDFGDKKLMVIYGQKPQLAEVVETEDHYEIIADVSGRRGVLHLGLLEDGLVEPFITMKIK